MKPSYIHKSILRLFFLKISIKLYTLHFFQSQCSSQERLHQLGAAGGLHHGGVAGASVGTPVSLGGGDDSRVPAFPRHFSSNDSNPSLIDDEGGRRSPSIRPRSRSLR